MKRKEREHLKEDPFQQFIAKAWEFLKKYQKHIYMGIAAIAAIIVIIVLVGFIKYQMALSENRLYGQAVIIKTDEKLTLDQKIEKLSQLKPKSGISASINLFLASLYYEKGDLQKTQEILDKFSGGSIKLLKDQKKLLEADILVANNKAAEALTQLDQLLNDPKTEIAKDYVLLKMAKIQSKNEQVDTAVANLNKIMTEYPQSVYTYEARTLLSQLEK